jgi:hypothetical protein
LLRATSILPSISSFVEDEVFGWPRTSKIRNVAVAELES